MPWLRVTGRTHNRRERGKLAEYKKGDTFHGSEHEARNFADRLTVVGSPDGRVALPLEREPGGQAAPKGGKEPEKEPEKDPGEGEGEGGKDTEIPEVSDDLTVKELLKMAADLDIAIPADAKKAEIRATIDEAIARM